MAAARQLGADGNGGSRPRASLRWSRSQPTRYEPTVDKEHLLFFVYGCQAYQGPVSCGRRPKCPRYRLTTLLAIRENQVLRNALSLCDIAPLRSQIQGCCVRNRRV